MFSLLILAALLGDDSLHKPELATLQAPPQFKVQFTTTRGVVVLQIDRSWAPHGADRFFNLVKAGYFQEVPFYRVVPGFVVQFGFTPDPAVNKVWNEAKFGDDAPNQSNVRGTISFATSGPDTRTCQFFINTVDNGRLDAMGFTPFGQVVQGMEIVDLIFSGYGQSPDQTRIRLEGGAYLKSQFPEMDYILSARVE